MARISLHVPWTFDLCVFFSAPLQCAWLANSQPVRKLQKIDASVMDQNMASRIRETGSGVPLMALKQRMAIEAAHVAMLRTKILPVRTRA